TPNGRWVPVQTVSLPSSSHSAVATRVSSGTWATYAAVYVASSRCAAVSNAASTLPVASSMAPAQPPASTGCRRRYSVSSASDGCGCSVQLASMDAITRSAVALSGAATPTKSPSTTATTPGIADAAATSTESSVAPNAGGRRIAPTSMSGRTTSTP